jgi:hypothetical protein
MASNRLTSPSLSSIPPRVRTTDRVNALRERAPLIAAETDESAGVAAVPRLSSVT